MAIIYNPLPSKVQVQAFGNYFEFAPEKIKSIDDKLARFITTNKAYTGLVELPEICIDEPTSEAAISAKKEAKTQGIRNAINYYQGVVRNLEVGLQKDLDMANIKIKSTQLATDGELSAMEKLVELQALQKNSVDDYGKEKSEKFERLKEKLNGDTKQPNTK